MSGQMRQLTGIGPDAGSLLGYLCALGALRAISLARPNERFKLSWQLGIGWRPVWHVPEAYNEQSFCKAIAEWLRTVFKPAVEIIGENPPKVETVDLQHLLDRDRMLCLRDRLAAQAVSRDDAVATEVLELAAAWSTGEDELKEKGKSDKSKQRTLVTPLAPFRGAGRQSFYGTLKKLLDQGCNTQEVHRALFERWRFDQRLGNGESDALRWHPRDDFFHRAPYVGKTDRPDTTEKGSEIGANVLAAVAMPLYPVALARADALVPGYEARGEAGEVLQLPVWRKPLDLTAIRSLLWHPRLRDSRLAAAADVVHVLAARRCISGKGYFYFAATQLGSR